MKAPYLAYSKSDESIDVMQAVRKLFDPRGILSPYAPRFPWPDHQLTRSLLTGTSSCQHQRHDDNREQLQEDDAMLSTRTARRATYSFARTFSSY